MRGRGGHTGRITFLTSSTRSCAWMLSGWSCLFGIGGCVDRWIPTQAPAAPLASQGVPLHYQHCRSQRFNHSYVQQHDGAGREEGARRDILYNLGVSLTKARMKDRALAPVGLNSVAMMAIKSVQQSAARQEESGAPRGRGGRPSRRRAYSPDESDGEHADGGGELVPPTGAEGESSGRCYMCLEAIRGESAKA